MGNKISSTGRTASGSAERTRRYRERRRSRLRCVVVEIGDADIVGLIRRGHLDRLARNDIAALRDALHRFFDTTIAAG